MSNDTRLAEIGRTLRQALATRPTGTDSWLNGYRDDVAWLLADRDRLTEQNGSLVARLRRAVEGLRGVDSHGKRQRIDQGRGLQAYVTKLLADIAKGDSAEEEAVGVADRELLEAALARAAWVAQHLFEMISPEEWRATGGDDGQGHYEGDYRAEQIAVEIAEWSALASLREQGGSGQGSKQETDAGASVRSGGGSE